MAATILAIIFFLVGLGIGMLIEHLRFIMGDRVRLEAEIVDLLATVSTGEREIAKLDRDNAILTNQLNHDVFRRIMETDGWMPLKGACLPADGERIKVAGVKTDVLQQAPGGYHYARFTRQNGQAGLSSLGTTVPVNLNGLVLWQPQ